MPLSRNRNSGPWRAVSVPNSSEEMLAYSSSPLHHCGPDADWPSVADEHIQNLVVLFVRHNAHKVLGVFLVQSHFKIPKRTVLPGADFEEPKGRWTRLTLVEKIDLATLHGHIFVFTTNGMCTYEYEDGPMLDLSSVDESFLEEFVGYLVANDLTDLLDLQVLTECVFNVGKPLPKLETVEDLKLALAREGIT